MKMITRVCTIVMILLFAVLAYGGEYILFVNNAYAAYSTPSSFTGRRYNGTWLWPLLGNHTYVSSYVGGRKAPTVGASTDHHGTDIPADSGTPIYAARSGIAYVMSSLFPGMARGLGNWVLIDHGDGFYTAYGHMSAVHSRFNNNKADVPVSIGDVIGYVGETGTARGSHLHFEIAYDWNGAGKASYYGHTWGARWGTNGWEIVDSSPATQSYVYWLEDLVKHGSEMSSGYDRTIPDGDYIIAIASNPLYYLDIVGTDVPAGNNTNVALCQAGSMDGIGECEIWTVTYNSSNKFYTIRQKGTNMCLDVSGDGIAERKNVQVYSSNSQYANPKTSNWAIIENGHGYRLQARCSGFALDASNGITNGSDVYQFGAHDKENQSWVFIPYKPSQPIQNGRYILLSAMDQGYELDVEGESGNVANMTNVRLWDINTPSQYNSFDITKLSNGYYSVIHAASGKSLDVNNGGPNNAQNIGLYSNHGGLTEQWAITPNGNGFVLRARNSGHALDIQGGKPINGANAMQYPYHGGRNQTWIFVPAEYTVSYDANGGEGAPADQIKYWHTPPLTLSDTVPTREGYTFKYWTSDAADAAQTESIYNPGDTYTADADLQLYAVWEQDGPRIELSAEEITLEQFGEEAELTATLHAGQSGATEVVWSCSRIGAEEWDEGLDLSANGNTYKIRPKEITGSYTVLCSTPGGAAMTSCTVIVQPAPVTGIALDQTGLVMNAGDMQTLTASITPNYTTLTDVNWTSSDPNVALVSDGDVYAIGEGAATITCESVSDHSVKATCVVSVAEEHLTLSETECALKQGVVLDLHANINAFDGNSTKLVWTYDDGIELSYTNGTDGGNVSIYSLNLGTYHISCQTDDGRLSATCTVTIIPADIEKVLISQSTLNLAAGETFELSASVEPYYAYNTGFTWTSSNTDVARVDSGNGMVSADGPGSATITCTSISDPAKKATCTVAVTVPLISIKLNRSVYEFSNSSEGSIELTATLSPDNATNKRVTWSSSNTGVATVSNGTVTPVAAGYARITCASPDGPIGVCDIAVHADRIFRLPRNLKVVEAESFYGTSLREVIIPDGATSINSGAFANCGKLALVNIPSSVSNIASDAFSGSNIAIVCDNACYATEYAESNGIPYIIGSLPREVAITADNTTLTIGKTATLRGQVLPDNAPSALRWAIVEGSDIATIKANGNSCILTANGTGHVAVSATAINSVTGIIDISIIDHPTSFGIRFDGNGGSVTTDHKAAEFDKAVGTMPAATWDYHTFNGWYTQAKDGTEVTAETVFSDYFMGDITLYAHWTENPWSDWVEPSQVPSGNVTTESKTQYRYQDASYGGWSGWSEWTTDRQSTSDVKKEESATVWRWYRFICPHCGAHMHVSNKCYTWAGGCGNSIGSSNVAVTWLNVSSGSGTQDWNGTGRVCYGSDTRNRWFYWVDSSQGYPNGMSAIGYRYATRSKNWGAWSGWSDTAVAGSSTRNVQTRTVYRYRVK